MTFIAGKNNLFSNHFPRKNIFYPFVRWALLSGNIKLLFSLENDVLRSKSLLSITVITVLTQLFVLFILSHTTFLEIKHTCSSCTFLYIFMRIKVKYSDHFFQDYCYSRYGTYIYSSSVITSSE
jgi:hypothetical protein